MNPISVAHKIYNKIIASYSLKSAKVMDRVGYSFCSIYSLGQNSNSTMQATPCTYKLIFLHFITENQTLKHVYFGITSALSPDKWIEFKLQDTARVSHNSQLYRYIMSFCLQNLQKRIFTTNLPVGNHFTCLVNITLTLSMFSNKDILSFVTIERVGEEC